MIHVIYAALIVVALLSGMLFGTALAIAYMRDHRRCRICQKAHINQYHEDITGWKITPIETEK